MYFCLFYDHAMNRGNLLKTGDLINVTDFRDQMLERKIVEISDETVYVCSQEEYDLASQMGKPPIVVGFNKRYVVKP